MANSSGKDVTGTYTLSKSDNFEEYLNALGVGWTLRKMSVAATPTAVITKEGENWKYVTKTTFKTTTIDFKMGEEFEEETGDGRKCTSVVQVKGPGFWTHKQKCEDGKEYMITREFKGNSMTMILEAGGVVSTRVYEKENTD